ncbi:MAG: DUF6178 family protein [Thermodesulfobacteriota bacterium]
MEVATHQERAIASSKGDIRIQREVSRILQLRGKDRMEAILSSDCSQEIFWSFPEEEAYFTIKEIGERDALPLLSLMSPEQCQYLLDLELWKGYEIQVNKVERWLPLLLSCDEEAIHRWLRSLDIDTLLLVLKKTIRLHLKENDETPVARDGTTSYFTLDGTHFIEVFIPSLQNPIEQLLKGLAHLDFNFYWKMLQQMAWEIGAELEERALHFREARLEDKGFPPMEEALSLYQYLNPRRLRRMLERKEIQFPALPDKAPPPAFPLVLKDLGMFLSLCLRELEEGALMDRLKMELAYMANQVMVADQPEEIDLSTLQASLSKLGGYLSVGLEMLADGDLLKAREWMEKVPLKFLFQIGFGASLELKWRAEKVWQKGWFSEKRIPLSFLGSPCEERIKGLLKKKPLCYDEDSESGYREFRSLGEIRSYRRDLDKIELLGRILSRLRPFSYTEGLQWKTVLLKAYRRDHPQCLSQEGINFGRETAASMGRRHTEKGEIKNSFRNWLLQKTGSLSGSDMNLLEELTRNVLDELELSGDSYEGA